jgi:hypothetical protein
MNGNVSTSVSNAKAQLSWLQTLTNNAESSFWVAAQAEQTSFGAVSANPLSVSDTLCTGATPACEVILREIAEITNATHTPLDWSTSVRTLNSVILGAATSGINRVLDLINALSNPPVAGYTHAPLKDAGDDLYAQALAWVETLGPNFMTPITALYPDAGVTGVTAEVVDSTGYKLVLTLTGTTPEWPHGSGTSFHELAAGDYVVITLLSVGRVDTTWAATTDFADFLNVPLEVSAVSGDELTLVCPDSVAAVVEEAVMDPDATPALGLGFIVRKIRGNEA